MKSIKPSRVYKIQKIGGAYYLAIPRILVRKRMLKLGVIIEVRKVSDDNIILELRTADAVKEHIKDSKENRENTSKLRTSNNIR